MATYTFGGFSFSDPNNFNLVENYTVGGEEATTLPGAGDTVLFELSGFGSLNVDSVDGLWVTAGAVTANSATGFVTTAGGTGAAAMITINGTISGNVLSHQGGNITADNATGTIQATGGIITIANSFTATSHGTNSIDLAVSSGGTLTIEGSLDVRNAGGMIVVGAGLMEVEDELLLGVAVNGVVINVFVPGNLPGIAKLAAKSLQIGSETVNRDDCGNWQHTGNNGALNIARNGYVAIAETLTLASPGLSQFDEGVQINLLGGGSSMQIGGDDGPVANRLTISAQGVLQGHGRIDAGTIVNEGTVFVIDGILRFTADSISGGGTVHIGDGTRFISSGDFFDPNSGANSNTITFGTRNSTSFLTESVLELDRPELFTGEITGLAVGDTIHLSGRQFLGNNQFGPNDSFRRWTGFENPTIAHTEIDPFTGELRLTFTDFVPFVDYNAPTLVRTFDVSGDALLDHIFSIRNLGFGETALGFMEESDQIVTGVDGSPTGGANPYIDALIHGWAKWDQDAGPITYWFGTTADVHNAVAVHGETNVIQCETTVGTWDSGGFEKAAVQHAVDVYESVTELRFEEATSVETANVVFWLTPIPGGALGASERPSQVPSGHLWVYLDDATWTIEGLQFGGDHSLEIVHELGHVLGLAHPHDGGVEADRNLFPGVGLNEAGNPGLFDQNQQIFTVMSYVRGWNGVEPSPPPNEYGSQGALGAFDIAALQLLYGRNDSYNNGDNTYILPTVNDAGTGWMAIWDTGGIDTIVNPSADTSEIDLRPAPLLGATAGGHISFVHDILGGFTIANDVVIENAIGGSGDDGFHGNAADNYMDGGDGIDRLYVDGNPEDYGLIAGGPHRWFIHDDRPGSPDGVDTLDNFEWVVFGDGTELELESGPPAGPEVTVTGNGASIADGDDSPDAADDTDFGPVPLGAIATRTFTVENDGTAPLTVSKLKVPKGFKLSEGVSSPIAPGQSDTFTVSIDTTKAGFKSGEITFTTNDPDEGTFNFTLAGDVVVLPPEIEVRGNGNLIADDDLAPDATDGTDFGDVAVGSTVAQTFTVNNTGPGTLTISKLKVPKGFKVSEGISSPIAAGESDTFTVTVDTKKAGLKSGQITFTTNDADEGAFNFALAADVVVLPPEIEVTGNGNPIGDDDLAPDVADGTDFGDVAVGSAVIQTFMVSNTGPGTLTISKLKAPKGFKVVDKLASSIASGESDTFSLQLDTKKVGLKTGQIVFATNDADEGAFNFALSGNVVAPAAPLRLDAAFGSETASLFGQADDQMPFHVGNLDISEPFPRNAMTDFDL